MSSIASAFTKLHKTGINLQFETSLESISKVLADLWQRKTKTELLLFSSDVKIK